MLERDALLGLDDELRQAITKLLVVLEHRAGQHRLVVPVHVGGARGSQRLAQVDHELVSVAFDAADSAREQLARTLVGVERRQLAEWHVVAHGARESQDSMRRRRGRAIGGCPCGREVLALALDRELFFGMGRASATNDSMRAASIVDCSSSSSAANASSTSREPWRNARARG